MHRFSATVIFLLLASFSALAQDGPPSYLLITNANIWDGTSDELAPGMNGLVENNVIRQISAEPIAANLSANTTVIDGGGPTMMPGLIEMHTHIMFQFGVPVSRTFDHAAMGAAAYEGMQTYMSMGYTTLRDVGGNSLSIARAIAEGRISGPRVYSSGGPIAGISGLSDLGLITVDPYESVFQKRGDSNVVTGPDEVTAAVRTILRQGALT